MKNKRNKKVGTILTFILFVLFMLVSLLLDISLIIPLALGFALFTLEAVRRGFTVKKVMILAAGSLKESFIVIRILLLIGCLTGMWRQSGTVAYFITLGLSLIPPQLFLLAAFLLSAVMAYALGTSFGVTATAGVILMSVARAGGVNTVLAAGAVLSGVYVGDRGSPAASSANLVAVLTKTDMRKNVRMMLGCSVVPFLLSCVLYGLLSARSPMQSIDSAVLSTLGAEFHLHWLCIVPALLMIVLPFCSVSIPLSMLASLAVSMLCAVFVQGAGIGACLHSMLFGFLPENDALSAMLSGGGMISMAEVCVILVISCSYGSIFQGVGLLDSVNVSIKELSDRIGRFPVMILLGLGVSALFCNQTIGVIMQSDLSEKLYGESDEEKTAKMLDIENSGILLAGLVPWCIACSVPLTMMSADARSVPFAFYLWLLPLWWLVRGKVRRQA